MKQEQNKEKYQWIHFFKKLKKNKKNKIDKPLDRMTKKIR